MTPRHLLMAAALLGAAGLAFFGDKTPTSELAEATPRAVGKPAAAASAPAARGDGAAAADLPAVRILALRPRADLLGDDGAALAGGDAVFRSQNWAPPPAPVVAQVQVAPPPPSAPPLPFTYLGKAVGEGSWEVYLARGDKTYSVRQDSVIDGQYHVDSIRPPTMSITYLPLKQVQQINIGVLD